MCWHEAGVEHATCWLLVRKDSGLVPHDDKLHHTGTIADYDITLKSGEWIRSVVAQGVLRVEPGYWSPSKDGRANFKHGMDANVTCGLVVLPPDDVLWKAWEATKPQDYRDWSADKVIARGAST